MFLLLLFYLLSEKLRLMKFKTIITWTVFAVFLFLFACKGNKKKEPTEIDHQVKGQPCNLDAPVIFSSAIPHEVDVNLPNGYQGLSPTVQPCFDIFSWESFIALNWPANADGSPSSGSISSNPAAQRVWEYYKDPAEVFGTNEQLLPFTGLFKMEPGLKGLRMFSKLSNELEIAPDLHLPAAIMEATGNPLIDKNLNFAMYEIKLNKDEVDYIIKDSLNTKEGQQGKKISFPAGSAAGIIGATEIKTTWKILEPGKDDTSKFYKSMAVIYVPANQSATGKPLYLKEWVGLVAMHILHKTTNFPFWVWTTFEHIDNAPEQAGVSKAGNNFSFYNPACPACSTNTAAPTPAGGNFIWQATKPYAKTYATDGQYGTQAVRLDTVYGPTDIINKKWQKALADAGSVFANYRLIGSQWSTILDAPPFDTIPAPTNLTNTTLETFIQPSSCTMTCHKFATDAVGISSDFSFILGHARSTAVLEAMKKKK
jgi:hypothetical protein